MARIRNGAQTAIAWLGLLTQNSRILSYFLTQHSRGMTHFLTQYSRGLAHFLTQHSRGLTHFLTRHSRGLTHFLTQPAVQQMSPPSQSSSSSQRTRGSLQGRSGVAINGHRPTLVCAEGQRSRRGQPGSRETSRAAGVTGCTVRPDGWLFFGAGGAGLNGTTDRAWDGSYIRPVLIPWVVRLELLKKVDKW